MTPRVKPARSRMLRQLRTLAWAVSEATLAERRAARSLARSTRVASPGGCWTSRSLRISSSDRARLSRRGSVGLTLALKAASISTNSLGSENGDWIIKSASLALCSDDHARSIAAPEYQSRQSLIRRTGWVASSARRRCSSIAWYWAEKYPGGASRAAWVRALGSRAVASSSRSRRTSLTTSTCQPPRCRRKRCFAGASAIVGSPLVGPQPSPIGLPAGVKLVLERGLILLAATARGREAADRHLVARGVDPQKALEHRRLIPVQPLREGQVEPAAPPRRQQGVQQP